MDVVAILTMKLHPQTRQQGVKLAKAHVTLHAYHMTVTSCAYHMTNSVTSCAYLIHMTNSVTSCAYHMTNSVTSCTHHMTNLEQSLEAVPPISESPDSVDVE